METRWPGWQRENFAAKEPHREQFGVMKLPWMFIVVVVACLHLMHNWHRTELREVCFTLSLKKSPVSLWINIDMQWAVLSPRTLETSAIITNLEHSYNSTYRKASFSFAHFVWPYKGLNQRLKDCVIGPYHPSSRICVCVWERDLREESTSLLGSGSWAPSRFAAVDRSVSSSLSDARDALVNAVVDPLSAYSSAVSSVPRSTLTAPSSLKLLPLYVLALLKQVVLYIS